MSVASSSVVAEKQWSSLADARHKRRIQNLNKIKEFIIINGGGPFKSVTDLNNYFEPLEIEKVAKNEFVK